MRKKKTGKLWTDLANELDDIAEYRGCVITDYTFRDFRTVLEAVRLLARDRSELETGDKAQ